MTDLTPEQLDALDAAATWLRECSGWLLSNDLDMTCPMETDPLDLADDLDAVVGHIIVAPVWQPIETAPECWMEEREVLLLLDDGRQAVSMRRDTDGQFWAGDWEYELRATHWMPLPTPPKGE